MKINIIGLTYPFRGGISHYTTLLCKHLSKKYEIKLISFKRLYPTILYPGKSQYDYNNDLKVNSENIIDTIQPITWIHAFLKIKKDNPDIVLLQWWNPILAPAYFIITLFLKIFLKSKTVYECHNVLPHESTFLDKILLKFAFYNVKYFVVHSKEDLKNLKKLKKHAQVGMVAHPNYDIFTKYRYNKQMAKTKLKLDNKKIVLFFGYVRKYKGLEYLIKAIPKVLKKIDVTLLIIGEFYENKKKYVSLIDKLNIKDNVKIIDRYVPNKDIGLYFSASDVVVLPYISATQSGIVQIAYSFDVPVIVTNVGGLPDTVIHNKTGYIVPARDSKKIAEAIIKYYIKEKEKIFRENIKNEKTKFSWEVFIKKIIEFINVE